MNNVQYYLFDKHSKGNEIVFLRVQNRFYLINTVEAQKKVCERLYFVNS